MEKVLIKLTTLNNDPAWVPNRAKQDDACYDLVARAFAEPGELSVEVTDIVIEPQGRVLAKTGVFLQLEPGWEAQIRPRSGLALKDGVTVLNTPGTVDAGYRNEVGVILFNSSKSPVKLGAGMRVAQMAFRPIPEHAIELIPPEDYDTNTDRNLGGFGHSGS